MTTFLTPVRIMDGVYEISTGARKVDVYRFSTGARKADGSYFFLGLPTFVGG
jgi:hypothetical protein